MLNEQLSLCLALFAGNEYWNGIGWMIWKEKLYVTNIGEVCQLVPRGRGNITIPFHCRLCWQNNKRG